MESETYDIAIIGGGLAGLSLAIQSAMEGYRVVLFEKETYPFHKVCGEYISMESWPFLERLGVTLQDLQLPLIDKLDISDANGKRYHFNLPLGGFGISRYKLDNILYKIALEKSVHFFTGTKVVDVNFPNDAFVIDTSAGQFKARLAAGSFGKRSNLDIKWKRSFAQQKAGKLHNYIGIKYHIKYPNVPNVIALHNFKDGYCGISSIEDGICCLCYLTTAQNLQLSGQSIKQMEEQVLGKNPRLQEIFTNAEFLYDEPLAISQISFGQKSQIENHVLMLGDAAGMITPLCGNGMSMAMHASKLAFENMHAFLQGKIERQLMEQSYTKQWRQTFAKRLWMGRQVQRVFGGTTTTATFLQTMKAIPPLAKAIIRSTHGKPF